MKVAYVAHKIRDPRGPFWMVRHIRAAEEVALELWRIGYATICPGLNTFMFDGSMPDSTWLNGDLEFINRSDCVVMCPNWSNSEGANSERDYAISHNIPIFYWPNDRDALIAFLQDKRAITQVVHLVRNNLEAEAANALTTE